MAVATEVIRRSMSTLAGLFTKKLPAGIWQFTFDEAGKGMKYAVNGRRYEFLAINGVMGITIDATNEKQLWYVISDDCTVQIEEVGQSANPFSSLSYEYGIWTPAITCATIGDLAVTYTTQAGYYTLIGNIVHLNARIQVNTIAHTTASGNWRISGLPHTIANIASYEPQFILAWSGVNSVVGIDLHAIGSSNSKLLQARVLYDNANWVTPSIADTTISNGDTISISGSYRKD
jgi:hypothetical protein